MSNTDNGKSILGAHLVGSVPLTDSAEVFHLCSSYVGEHLQRLPDGETGARSNWIAWQRQAFTAKPWLPSG